MGPNPHLDADPDAWASGYAAVAHVFVASLDDACTVSGDDGHHLARVRRLRIGESITAADDAGSWRPYEIAAVSGGTLDLVAVGEAREEPRNEPRLAVAFALTKGEKPERVVAQLTELGVDRILPVVARRSVVRWDDTRRATALERFRRVAREAAMQAHRVHLPEIGDVAQLASLAGHPALLVAEVGAARPPSGVPAGGEWLVVVGPEGGLEAGEVVALEPVGRLAVGPHVLRAETAAVAVASALAFTRPLG
ncbi:MAG: RsmE family RNA methyltransferase [Acidimicrobiia bacterium]